MPPLIVEAGRIDACLFTDCSTVSHHHFSTWHGTLNITVIQHILLELNLTQPTNALYVATDAGKC